MRRRHAWEEEDRDVGLQIAPLLDLLFVMLLFFMVTAGGHRTERELSMKVAPAAAAPHDAAGNGPPETVLRIGIGAGGELSLDGNAIDVASLRAALETARIKDPRVIVAPAARAVQEKVVMVLQACAAASIDRVALAECE